MSEREAKQEGGGDDERTGLPVLTRWPAVYAFVLVAFAVMVGLLYWLSRAFA